MEGQAGARYVRVADGSESSPEEGFFGRIKRNFRTILTICALCVLGLSAAAYFGAGDMVRGVALPLSHHELSQINVARWTVDDWAREFQGWMDKYDVKYSSSAEYERRLDIFMKNVMEVYLHNTTPGISYTMEVNQFADKDHHELTQFLSYTPSSNILGEKWKWGSEWAEDARIKPQEDIGLNRWQAARGETRLPQMRHNVTDRYNEKVWDYDVTKPHADWRESRCLGPVVDQGQCGSCYAFSAVNALEAQLCLDPLERSDVKYLEFSALSKQQMVDCSRDQGNNGCGGGWYETTWYHYQEKRIFCFEKEYAYTSGQTAEPTECVEMDQCVHVMPEITVEGLEANPMDVMNALDKIGPLSIAVGVDTKWFKYSDGILDRCHAPVNHAVILAGYGYDENLEKNYWLIKNSWGPKWGNGGYMRIFRGDLHMKFDTCHVLFDVALVYPSHSPTMKAIKNHPSNIKKNVSSNDASVDHAKEEHHERDEHHDESVASTRTNGSTKSNSQRLRDVYPPLT